MWQIVAESKCRRGLSRHNLCENHESFGLCFSSVVWFFGGVLRIVWSMWHGDIICSNRSLYIGTTLAIKYDHTLDRFQKLSQLLFVWLIPIFGASFVIHLVYDHSPEAIPKNWIPWPFKTLIYGKPIKRNNNRDNNEMEPSGERHHHRDSTGGDSGGGGD